MIMENRLLAISVFVGVVVLLGFSKFFILREGLVEEKIKQTESPYIVQFAYPYLSCTALATKNHLSSGETCIYLGGQLIESSDDIMVWNFRVQRWVTAKRDEVNGLKTVISCGSDINNEYLPVILKCPFGCDFEIK